MVYLFVLVILGKMAENRSTVAMNGRNYGTWKTQLRLALLRDGLWGIVQGTEEEPVRTETNAAEIDKFVGRRDKALATIGLSVDTSLLDGVDLPNVAWQKMHDQFCRKTWANKLELKRKLHSLRLDEGRSVQEHIREITELFRGLAEMDSALTEEDKAVYLLGSLPESFV